MAATLSANCIKSVEVLDMEELGMEAVWKIKVHHQSLNMLFDERRGENQIHSVGMNRRGPAFFVVRNFYVDI